MHPHLNPRPAAPYSRTHTLSPACVHALARTCIHALSHAFTHSRTHARTRALALARAPRPQELNEAFHTDLARFLDPDCPADEAVLISIDALGADVRVRTGGEFNVERIGFGSRVETPDEARAAMRAALAAGRR
jgi:hypothetical protein